MQSSKPSKKSLKKGEETAAETTPAAEPKAARSSRTPKPAKEKIEPTSAKVHRRSPVSSSLRTDSNSTPAAHAMTGAAGPGLGSNGGSIIDSVGLVAAPAAESRVPSASQSNATLSPDEIARLAYSYWEARGFTHGMADEDWIRAEAELLAKGR